MKVLYVISTLRRSGPVNLYYNIIKSHNRTIVQPAVLTLSPEDKFSRIKEFEELGIPLYSLNLSRQDLFLKGKQSFIAILKTIQPDVINSCGVRPDMMCALFAKKYKTVTYQQNYPYEDYSMLYGKSGYLLAYVQLRFIMKLSSIVACSHHIAKKIGAIVNRELPIVSNGVIFGFKKLKNDELNKLRSTLGISDEQIVFLFAGNLIKRKQPQVIIKAFKLLEQSIKNKVALIILGDGELMESCKHLAENIPNIKFVGKVSNVSPYMQISHYYVSAALSEGLPVAVIEAMNHGLGIILSDIPQHREFFHQKTVGFLFKEGNVADAREKMETATESNQKEISVNAIESVKTNFTSEIMARKFESIYLAL